MSSASRSGAPEEARGDVFVPLAALRRRHHWQAARPLRRRAMENGKVLLLHPPSGSWSLVAEADLPLVEALLTAADQGLLDGVAETGEHPLVRQLLHAGLLLEDGRRTGAPAKLRHSDNPVSMLILKLVGYCNLACTYCYDYNQVTYRQRMSVETAREAIAQSLARSGEGLNILFHGGEPLLAFDEIRELVPYARARAAEAGRSVLFTVQTNGTRFTPEVVEFLLAERFAVGLSIDGPPEVNDLLRVDHAGRGHHAEIERALCSHPELRSRIGVLTTVTRHNVRLLPAIAAYLRDQGFECWDLTVFQSAGRGEGRSDEFAPDISDLIAAYVGLLDCVESGSFENFEICPVLHYLRNVLSDSRRNMCLRNGCGAASDLVSVSVDGTVEACDCIRDPALRLGSVGQGGLVAALESATAQAIRSRSVDTLAPCSACDWRLFCGGTCLAKAGDLAAVDSQECQLSLALFPEIFRRLAASDRLERYARRFT